MPRVSRAQTDSNRAAIEEAASTLIRARGIQGVSVANLMAEVGLTHGGFYGHFASKDALAAVACERAFAQAHTRWTARVADQPPAAARAALVNAYLSPQNRDSMATGCPLPALAGDVAREAPDKPIRAAYLAGIQGLLDILQAQLATGDAHTNHRQALVEMSTLAGALLLSRATQGSGLSDDLLAAAHAHLLPTHPL